MSLTAKIELNSVKTDLKDNRVIITIKYSVNGKDKEVSKEIDLGYIKC